MSSFEKNHFIFDFVEMSRIIQTRFCCPNSNTIAIDHTVCASCVYNVQCTHSLKDVRMHYSKRLFGLWCMKWIEFPLHCHILLFVGAAF